MYIYVGMNGGLVTIISQYIDAGGEDQIRIEFKLDEIKFRCFYI